MKKPYQTFSNTCFLSFKDDDDADLFVSRDWKLILFIFIHMEIVKTVAILFDIQSSQFWKVVSCLHFV
jgi:hypothetical protein